MHENVLVTYFLFPLLVCSILHIASSLAVRAGIYRKGSHRTAWNTVLLAAFAVCSATGALLSLRMFLPDLRLATHLHNQSGAILLAAGFGHSIERSGWFLAKAKTAWAAARNAGRQWPGVAVALLALLLLLALPSAMAEIVAQRRSVPRMAAIEPVPAVGTKAAPTENPAADAKDGSAAAAARTAASRERIGNRPAKIIEADRILSIGDVTANPKRVPVRIDNRSMVATPQIEALLRQVKDPEVALNIYDLGLIRTIDVDSTGNLAVGLVLTTPTCPNNAWLVGRLKERLAESGLFRTTKVSLIEDISWSPNFITAEGSRSIVELGKW